MRPSPLRYRGTMPVNNVSTVGASTSRGWALAGVDGRTVAARRFRDLIAEFSADLGGMAALGNAERTLIRQAAALTMEAERVQAFIVKGEHVTHDALVRIPSEARRILLSLAARAKP